MNLEHLQQLLIQKEGLKLDFKRKLYEIDHATPAVAEMQWDEFIKDVLALANGNINTAAQPGYLIIGLDDKLVANTRARFDVDLPEVEKFQRRVFDKVNAACHPKLPDLQCDLLTWPTGERTLVITIPPLRHLHETTRRLTTPDDNGKGKIAYQEHTVFIRRQEGVRIASNEERKALELEKQRYTPIPPTPLTLAARNPLRQSPLSDSDPFGDRGKIVDPNRYFVREPFTTHLLAELHKGQSLSIVAGSQMGKSSLLLHIHRCLPESVYLNCELLRTDADFFDELCTELDMEKMPARQLFRALKGRRVVVAIDEIENFVNFSHYARSELSGLTDGATAPLQLLIASRTPLAHLFLDNANETSPLGRLCLETKLPPFTLAEAHALVRYRLENTGLVLPTAAIEAAWQESQGQPQKLQEGLKEALERQHGVG